MEWFAVGMALFYGVSTSISPCPLAGNIAAISFLARKVAHARQAFLAGLAYTLGRCAAYALVAAALVAGLTADGAASRFLQTYLNQILGPVLILAGMALLGMLGGSLSLNLAGQRVQERAGAGLLWSFALGFLLALSFCPVSAGFFFGALLPLAVAHQSQVFLPALYGVGTAVPVLVFAFLVVFGSASVGRAFNRLTQVERWVRNATGVIFVLAGLYYCVVYIYGGGGGV
jgi:cytochrome c-type biogenesis protein